MKALIAAKQAGQEVAEVQHAKMAPVIDLMEALKKSIAEKEKPAAAKKPPVRAVPAAAAREQEQETRTPKRKRSAGCGLRGRAKKKILRLAPAGHCLSRTGV